MKEEYSPHKIVHHPEILEKFRNGESVFPIQVHLVPTNRCNQNCSFCAYRMHGYSSSQNFGTSSHMPSEKLLEIVDDLADNGCKAIQFTGGGEPLVHEGIVPTMRRIYERNMDVAMVSNGQAMNDEVVNLLSNSAWVRISVDSFSAQTYSQTRGVPERTFNTVLSNIQNLVKKKSDNTILGIGYVVTKENHKEVYQATKLFKELGVNNIRISAAFTTEGFAYFDSFFEKVKEDVSKAVSDFSDENFTVFNLFDSRVQDLFKGTQNYSFCPMKNLVPYIGADLNVYTCCTLAYNDLGVIGSLKDQKFSELWHNPDTVKFMKEHNPNKMCRLPCMFETKNRFINYCISSNPRHKNYI